jgi:hypothetical protein
MIPVVVPLRLHPLVDLSIQLDDLLDSAALAG